MPGAKGSRLNRALVFDLDGTLIDSRLDIANAVNHVRRGLGLPELPLPEVMGYVGDGARQLLARSLSLPLEGPELDLLLPEFLDYYTAHSTIATRPMPGVPEALAALSDWPLALCTNKPRPTTEAVLKDLGWTSLFRSVVAGGDLPNHKPHPDPLLRIAQAMETAPTRLVMIGDGPQDIQCGRAVGARTVAVAGGFAPESALRAESPEFWLESMSELPDCVRGWPVDWGSS